MRKHVVAGIVAHSYNTLEVLRDFTEANGLAVEPLKFSWHDPTGCVAAVLTIARKH